jgi:hypothetical protein
MENKKTWLEKTIEFECPECGSLPSTPCLTERLKARPPHKARIEQARKTYPKGFYG